MKIRNIDINEIEVFSNITSASFKKYLLSWIKDGITKLDWCFAAFHNSELIGRIVYGVYDNELEILDVTVKDSNKNAIDSLLQNSLKEMKIKGFKKIECHLYSDKVNYEDYVNSLKKCGFKITQEKKSFIKESSSINEKSGRLIFKNLQETGQNEFINAIEKVTENTLDKDDLDCIKEFGTRQAAVNYFNQLKDIDFNKSWWKLAYTADNKLVGLVVSQKFDEKNGAINYIGVVPEKRGNGYINDLLEEGVKTLVEDNIKKIIGDIDVNNFPLEKALNKKGFKYDCSMFVLKMYF